MMKNNKAYNLLVQSPPASCVAGAYRDYIGGYIHGPLVNIPVFMRSDNSQSYYWQDRQITREVGVTGLSTIYVDVEYMGYPLRVMRLHEYGLHTGIDIYGKGIKYLNEVEEWRKIVKLLKKFNIVEMTLTRYDDAIDIINGRMWRPLKTHNKIKQKIYGKDKKLEYIAIGSKRSATFIRVYNKTKELQDRGTAWLYPEYNGLRITRYEVQTTSKGISPDEKIIKICDLEYFAKQVSTPPPHNTKTHKNQKQIKTDICVMARELRRQPKQIKDYAKKKFLFLYKDDVIRSNNDETGEIEKTSQKGLKKNEVQKVETVQEIIF